MFCNTCVCYTVSFPATMDINDNLMAGIALMSEFICWLTSGGLCLYLTLAKQSEIKYGQIHIQNSTLLRFEPLIPTSTFLVLWWDSNLRSQSVLPRWWTYYMYSPSPPNNSYRWIISLLPPIAVFIAGYYTPSLLHSPPDIGLWLIYRDQGRWLNTGAA